MNNTEIESYFGVTLESNIIKQDSNTLVVLLPGIGYILDRPLMDYSKKLALELKYDVLPIEYGFQVARKEFNKEKDFTILLQESVKQFNLAVNKTYIEIIFIGKSLGTIIQNFLNHEVKEFRVKNIYLTPVNKTYEVGMAENSLVISGTNDPLINKETRINIRKLDGVKFIDIEGGDHSLNIKDDIIKSIENLKKVIKLEKEYLINN